MTRDLHWFDYFILDGDHLRYYSLWFNLSDRVILGFCSWSVLVVRMIRNSCGGGGGWLGGGLWSGSRVSGGGSFRDSQGDWDRAGGYVSGVLSGGDRHWSWNLGRNMLIFIVGNEAC